MTKIGVKVNKVKKQNKIDLMNFATVNPDLVQWKISFASFLFLTYLNKVSEDKTIPITAHTNGHIIMITIVGQVAE